MNFDLFIDIEYIELEFFLALPVICIITTYCFGVVLPVRFELTPLLLPMSVTAEIKPKQIQNKRERERRNSSEYVVLLSIIYSDRNRTISENTLHQTIPRVSIVHSP